jgi:hypothetical protein
MSAVAHDHDTASANCQATASDQLGWLGTLDFHPRNYFVLTLGRTPKYFAIYLLLFFRIGVANELRQRRRSAGLVLTE